MGFSELVLGTFVVSLVWIFTGIKRGEGPLPPGPKGLPIIGVTFIHLFSSSTYNLFQNVADMPKEEEWITFAEWGRKWGVY